MWIRLVWVSIFYILSRLVFLVLWDWFLSLGIGDSGMEEEVRGRGFIVVLVVRGGRFILIWV